MKVKFKSALDRILNPKTTTDGISILGVLLSFWLAPDYAKEISATIGVIWGTLKMFQKD